MVSQLLQEFELLAMDRCLELAARGRGEVEPNPLVGAVLLRDEEIRAEGLASALRLRARRGSTAFRGALTNWFAARRLWSTWSLVRITAKRRPVRIC